MSEIEDEIGQLIDAVKQSQTYKEYDRQKKLLKANPELKRRVDEYRMENFRLQNSNDDPRIADKMEAFADKYADFIESPQVSAFLDAEVNLCRMMQELTNRVVDSLDFE